MKKQVLSGLIPALVFMLLIQGIGCGTAKSVYRKVTPEKVGLKKRVLVLPILDQAGVGETKAEQITNALVERLGKDEHLLLRTAKNPSPSARRSRSPRFAIVIDPALIKSADEMGINVLIAGVLNPFELTARKTGMWPVRWIRRRVEVSLLVNAYDIIDGTLFLTHLETRKIKISGDDLEFEDSVERLIEEELEEVLSDIVEDQASAIAEGLRDRPWRGKVMSADGETITINAGRDIGMTEGNVFEVFGKGDAIRSTSGRFFYLLGPKVGEIRAVKVMDSHAAAVPLTEGDFKAGQVIKIK